MTRRSLSLLFSLPLLLLASGPALAQEKADGLLDSNSKETARALFEATQRGRTTLLQERLLLARRVKELSVQEYQRGRGTLSQLVDAEEQLLRARLPLCSTRAERVAARVEHYHGALAAEHILRIRFEAARINLADMTQGKLRRIRAEIDLLQAGAADEPLGSEDPLLSSPSLSDAARRGSRPSLGELQRAGREAAQLHWLLRYHEFRLGRGSLDSLQQAARSLVEIQLLGPQADPLAALAQHWRAARAAENIIAARYRSGRVGLADLMQTRQARLEAALQLRDACNRHKRAEPLPHSFEPGTFSTARADETADFLAPLHEERAEARAQHELLQASPAQLRRERRDAARAAVQLQLQAFRQGRGTLFQLMAAEEQALAAELAVLDRPEDRAAQYQRSWEMARFSEGILEVRYQSSRAREADLLSARIQRLDAEIRMLEAREKAGQE